VTRTVDKEEALALLEAHTRALLSTDEQCVMCALRSGRGAPGLIRETEHGVVALDRFGSERGHLLVIAKRHVERETELPWPAYREIQRLAYDACHALRRALSPRRVYVAALGAESPLPMSFPHYHLHVIPIYEVDERARPARVLSWSSGVIVYDESEALALASVIREAHSNTGICDQ
jgi:diadenosine tetraphosphate (Ap4A) HIT family hydrolase